MSFLEPQQLRKILRSGATAGLLLFLGLFFLASVLGRFGIESGDLCNTPSLNPNADLIQRDADAQLGQIAEGFADKVESATKWVYNMVFVSTLQEFDMFFNAQPISCARDIGPNAIAGCFLLYLCIFLLFPPDRRSNWLLVAVCAFLLALTNSMGGIGIMLFCGIWYWLTQQPKFNSIRHALYIPTLGLIFIGLLMVALAFSGLLNDHLSHAAIHSARLAQYYEAIHLIRESPYLGMGLGYKLADTYGDIYVHNFLLSSGVMMGILGLFSASAIVGILLLYIARSLAYPLDLKAYGKQAAVASTLLLFSPLLSLMTRSSIESIFLLADWISLAIFIVLMGHDRYRQLKLTPNYQITNPQLKA